MLYPHFQIRDTYSIRVHSPVPTTRKNTQNTQNPFLDLRLTEVQRLVIANANVMQR